MALEIERKFLIKKLPQLENGVEIVQGYLSYSPPVRVRIAGDRAFLTIKGRVDSITRLEYEYEIPLTDAREMMRLCRSKLEKVRYRLGRWEIDVFSGDNEGLIIAEIELATPDEKFERPSWLGKEITDDASYYNYNLSKRPYSQW